MLILWFISLESLKANQRLQTGRVLHEAQSSLESRRTLPDATQANPKYLTIFLAHPLSIHLAGCWECPPSQKYLYNCLGKVVSLMEVQKQERPKAKENCLPSSLAVEMQSLLSEMTYRLSMEGRSSSDRCRCTGLQKEGWACQRWLLCSFFSMRSCVIHYQLYHLNPLIISLPLPVHISSSFNLEAPSFLVNYCQQNGYKIIYQRHPRIRHTF